MKKHDDNFNNYNIEGTKIKNYLIKKHLKIIGFNLPGDRVEILRTFEEKKLYLNSVYLKEFIILIII